MTDTNQRVKKAYNRWARIYDSDKNPTRDLNAGVLRGAALELDNKKVPEIKPFRTNIPLTAFFYDGFISGFYFYAGYGFIDIEEMVADFFQPAHVIQEDKSHLVGVGILL